MATLIEVATPEGTKRCTARCYAAQSESAKRCTCCCGGRMHGVGFDEAQVRVYEVTADLDLGPGSQVQLRL